jgi:hypothetical protein
MWIYADVCGCNIVTRVHVCMYDVDKWCYFADVLDLGKDVPVWPGQLQTWRGGIFIMVAIDIVAAIKLMTNKLLAQRNQGLDTFSRFPISSSYAVIARKLAASP